jgi:hypothetical protein
MDSALSAPILKILCGQHRIKAASEEQSTNMIQSFRNRMEFVVQTGGNMTFKWKRFVVWGQEQILLQFVSILCNTAYLKVC